MIGKITSKCYCENDIAQDAWLQRSPGNREIVLLKAISVGRWREPQVKVINVKKKSYFMPTNENSDGSSTICPVAVNGFSMVVPYLNWTRDKLCNCSRCKGLPISSRQLQKRQMVPPPSLLQMWPDTFFRKKKSLYLSSKTQEKDFWAKRANYFLTLKNFIR